MIKKFDEYKKIILDLVKLSLPIIAGNLAQVLISITDTIVAGRYSTTALGAISVASAIVMTITIGAYGFIHSVSPVISNLRGKKQPAKKYFKLTILFSILISLPFFIILEIFLFNIDLIKLSPDMVNYIKEYIAICVWSIFPVAIFIAVKDFLQAYEKVVFANILMVLMVILNLVLNIILTFGFYNIQPLGVVGIAISTVISRTIVVILLLIYCFSLFKKKFFNSIEYIKDLLKIGAPVSMAMFFEFFGFNLTAVIIGKFSSLYAAVHEIILCIANFSFMIALSVSNAASVKIGYYNGAKDKENIIKYSKANFLIIMLICICTFSILSFWHNEIISIFSKDIEVINLSKSILKIAICFLFFDGIQCANVGILKGLKDTKIIMYTMLLAYMLIAIPIGCYLAFYHNIILKGFWIGLALALFSAAIITSLRVIYNIKKMKNN